MKSAGVSVALLACLTFSRTSAAEILIVKVADWLTFLSQMQGYNSPIVQKALAGKSPRVRAAELVSESKLKDVELRKKLFEGGKKAVDDSLFVPKPRA